MYIYKLIWIVALSLTTPQVLYATQKHEEDLLISSFTLKENLVKNDKLAIIALDKNGKALEEINGTFQFIINGFKESISFNNGVGITPKSIDNSTFVYLKHENISGEHNALFYVLKKEAQLTTFKIGWKFLLVVPALLILFMFMFKKLIWFAALLVLGYLYLTNKQGLDLFQYLEIIISGIKNVVS